MILTVEDEEGIMDDEVFSLEDEDPGGGRKKEPATRNRENINNVKCDLNKNT